MTTADCFHRACLLCVVIFWATCLPANAATALPRSQSRALANQGFFCRGPYDPHACEERIAQLKALLIEYPKGAQKHWRWVIVASKDWQPLFQGLHLPRESPAFTNSREHATFLEDALFFAQPGRTEELVQHFATPFDQLLSAAVRHELGHAICHGGSEAVANRVAEQLRGGKYPDCIDDWQKLSPMDELYYRYQLAGSRRR